MSLAASSGPPVTDATVDGTGSVRDHPAQEEIGRMSPNVISRGRLREGIVDCPLCGRQFATPDDHLLTYGAVEQPTVENADAIECPICDGVVFIVDEPAETG